VSDHLHAAAALPPHPGWAGKAASMEVSENSLVPLSGIERLVRRVVSNMETVRAFEVLSNRISEIHRTSNELTEIVVVGLQSAPSVNLLCQ
jgi:predicted cobalt transporter CbtA